MELEQVQQLYEKQKHDPPISRNLPPVAGNITWSRCEFYVRGQKLSRAVRAAALSAARAYRGLYYKS